MKFVISRNISGNTQVEVKNSAELTFSVIWFFAWNTEISLSTRSVLPS